MIISLDSNNGSAFIEAYTQMPVSPISFPSPILSSSDWFCVRSSDSLCVHGSNLFCVRGSEKARVRSSDSSRVRSSDLFCVRGSDSSAVSVPDSVSLFASSLPSVSQSARNLPESDLARIYPSACDLPENSAFPTQSFSLSCSDRALKQPQSTHSNFADIHVFLSTKKKYKPVMLKVKPVLAEFPERF